MVYLSNEDMKEYFEKFVVVNIFCLPGRVCASGLTIPEFLKNASTVGRDRCNRTMYVGKDRLYFIEIVPCM